MFNLFLKCYTQKYFDFRNRANRLEYISFILFYSLLCLLINLLSIIFQINYTYTSVVILAIQLFSLLPQIALTARRLHDFGYSGFLQLILVPIWFFIKYYNYNNAIIIIGISFGVMLLFFKGTPGPKKYGPPPEY